ncbi:MAG: O-methyltransferase [Defluviitaleaceae bacterium]|nr:O-methyltransferase [Defluviitaleaceae bacterium]
MIQKNYLNNLYTEEKWLANLRASHLDFPIAKKETTRFLTTILAMKQPKKVLEIGTCIGFSTMLMAKYIEDIHITTIERHKMMIDKAKFHFDQYNVAHKIELIEENALYALENMDNTYDLIFLDAAKGQYINFLPHILRLLNMGGTLISDNLLQLAGKDYNTIEKRMRTIYNNMQQFIEAITTTPQLETTILPIGDGIGLSVRV